jgi:Holliday junction resolvase-like predicted endonuclease
MNRRGSQREHQVCHELRQRGYFCVRSAGSHGPVDVVALRNGGGWLVQVKSDSKDYGPFNNFGPKEREELRAAAAAAGLPPMLLWWPPYGSLTWIPETSWPDADA